MSDPRKRKPVSDFIEVVADHMDLGSEEKRFLHEEAHNIYNKAFIEGQESKLQAAADEVEGLTPYRRVNGDIQLLPKGMESHTARALDMLKGQVEGLETVAHTELYPEDPTAKWVNKSDVLQLIEEVSDE